MKVGELVQLLLMQKELSNSKGDNGILFIIYFSRQFNFLLKIFISYLANILQHTYKFWNFFKNSNPDLLSVGAAPLLHFKVFNRA